jgi:phosphonate transport system ATP-binding protein
VLEELQSIASTDGITILCSLHQENLALQYGNHIIGLREGRIVVDEPRASFSSDHRAKIYQVQDTVGNSLS